MTAQQQPASSSACPMQTKDGSRLHSLSDSVLPNDIVQSIHDFAVLNQSDVPIPRWRRGGMQPLPLGIFRSSMVPQSAREAISLDAELSKVLTGFSVEVSIKIVSTRDGRTEGVVCDLGVAGLSFIAGNIVLWAKTTSGITQEIVMKQHAERYHFLFSIVPGVEMVLYIDGVKVAREALPGRMQFQELTTVALCRSHEGSHVRTCPAHDPISDIEPCETKNTIAVVPTKGTLGDVKVYDFPMSARAAHLAYLTGDHLA